MVGNTQAILSPGRVTEQCVKLYAFDVLGEFSALTDGYESTLDFARRRPLRIWLNFTLFFNQNQKMA
jgi:hypothetical protein